MSCDLVFKNEDGRLVVVSSGAWSVIAEKDGTISVNYPCSAHVTGIIATNINISIATFLKYKEHCQQKSTDMNLAGENIQFIVREFGQENVKDKYNSSNRSNRRSEI